jgi:hypothetical protein
MRRRYGPLAAWATIPLALLALSGCGPGGSDGGVASAGGGAARTSVAPAGEAPAADPDERRLQFTRCLRDHGINISDVPAGGRPGGGQLAGVDRTKLQAAVQACQQYSGGLAGGQTPSPEERQQLLDYIKCLRGKGIDIADPDPKTGRPQQRDFGKFVNPDQQMKDAMAACQQFRPNGLGGRGTG